MLQSLNLNQPVYFEPTDAAWRIIKDAYAPGESPESASFMESFHRNSLVPINTDSGRREFICMQAHAAMNLFGRYMQPGAEPVFAGNALYVGQDSLSRLLSGHAFLPPASVCTLPPGATAYVPTGASTGDTVRVDLSTKDEVYACWADRKFPDGPVMPLPVIPGDHDYVVRDRKSDIMLRNTSKDSQATCRIAFARYSVKPPQPVKEPGK